MRVVPAVLLTMLAAATAGHAALAAAAGDAAARKIAGMKNYRAYCADCHGQQGAGDGPAAQSAADRPPDFTTPQAVVSYSRERMVAGVTSAHPDTVRTAWNALDHDGAADVVAYMREAFMLPAPVADASAGRAIYARTCSVCHGDKGDGASWARNSLNPPPRDFTDAQTRELSRRHMINTVTYGSPDSAMKGFAIQMSRQDIAAVVDYVRATFVYPLGIPEDDDLPAIGNRAHAHGGDQRHAGHNHAAGPADMTLPLPGGLVGDRHAGGVFFDANCATCHGKDGDGKGPRAYFIQPKPADFTSPEAREEMNRPNLFTMISDGSAGSEMPAWSKVLDDQQIANVAEYLFTAFIQPAAGQMPPAPVWEQKKKSP